jgi:1-acyl-sn-glycerol-3-phosphate acyltransferase
VKHHEPPASAHIPHPARLMLNRLRPPAARYLLRRYRVQQHGAHRVPLEGPVILAANHVGILDGPLLAVFAPRPVHALTKQEMFEGRTGRFLRRSGQIPLDRYAADPRAVRTTLRVLRDGGAIGVFPEGTRGDGELHRFHHGAAYLALVSGAPIVPVILLGTRLPGGDINSVPPKGHQIDLVYGEPVRVEPKPWPRKPGMVRETSLLLQERMLSTLDEARTKTGRNLPGPLPAGQSEDDPETGLLEEGDR